MRSFDAGLPVDLVLADRPCAGLEIARSHGIAAELVGRDAYGGFGSDFDRDGYSATVAATLVAHQIDLVAMAGFGTLLTEPVHRAFPGRILNTHPSLLPAFPGWHAVRDALATGATETGCTVHIAVLEMDAGPILAQETVQIAYRDTEESLHERIKVVERSLYPATIAWALRELEAGREIESPLASPTQTGGESAQPEHAAAPGALDPDLAQRGHVVAPGHGRAPALARHHDHRRAARRHHVHAQVARRPPRRAGLPAW